MFEIGLVDIHKNIVQSSSLIIMLLEKFPYVRCKLTTYFRRVFFCNIHNVVSYVNFLVFTQFYQFKSVLFLLKLFSNFHIFFIVLFTLFLEWTILFLYIYFVLFSRETYWSYLPFHRVQFNTKLTKNFNLKLVNNFFFIITLLPSLVTFLKYQSFCDNRIDQFVKHDLKLVIRRSILFGLSKTLKETGSKWNA